MISTYILIHQPSAAITAISASLHGAVGDKVDLLKLFKQMTPAPPVERRGLKSSWRTGFWIPLGMTHIANWKVTTHCFFVNR